MIPFQLSACGEVMSEERVVALGIDCLDTHRAIPGSVMRRAWSRCNRSWSVGPGGPMIVVRYIRANDPGCRGADRHIIDRDLEIRHRTVVVIVRPHPLI
jgi:hypothetical protein